MYNTFKKYGVTHRGFTLIELLVVVLIIGILAAVALPQYQKAVYKARATEAVAIMSNLQKAVDVYSLEHGWGTAFKDITEDLDMSIPDSTCFSPVNVTYEYNSASDFYYAIGTTKHFNSCNQGLALVWYKYPTKNWEKECWYYPDTPSEIFCQELGKQGWDIVDY